MKMFIVKVFLKKKETFNCRNCNKEFETQKGAIFYENVPKMNVIDVVVQDIIQIIAMQNLI
jgi:peptide subunit release factor 1 (eRF1)